MASELEALVRDVEEKRQTLDRARREREQSKLRAAAEARALQLKVEAAALEEEIRLLASPPAAELTELQMKNATEMRKLQTLLNLTGDGDVLGGSEDDDGDHLSSVHFLSRHVWRLHSSHSMLHEYRAC